MYHGSPEGGLSLIRAPRVLSRVDQIGIWLTSDPKMAEMYGAHVYEVFAPKCDQIYWVGAVEDPFLVSGVVEQFPARMHAFQSRLAEPASASERQDLLTGEHGVYRDKRYSSAVKKHYRDAGYCALLWPDAVEFDMYPGKADVMLVLEPREISVRREVT